MEIFKQQRYVNSDNGFAVGIFSIITFIIGLALICSGENCRKVFTTCIDIYSDIKRGTMWTNGNSKVVIVRVYENKVVYSRYSGSGKIKETCTLSKRVFRERYTKVSNEREI